MTGMTRRQLVGATGASALTLSLPALALQKAAVTVPPLHSSFRPGEVWLDTAGKPIQAHGGSLIKVGDTFYWYGENKEFTTGKTKVWTWGIRCYSSKDLYNWDDLGLAIPPDQNDPTSPLHPHAMVDRPHILYNATTKKFVCWIKVMGASYQTRVVLVADKITGPYTMVNRELHPLGMSAGDFDLVASADDGKAYMYFERVHSEMICADLTEDYINLTGYYSTHFPSAGPPMVREGPAYFRRKGKHYLATSGTTSYFPNPSEVAVAETFHGPFTVLGDLHPTDRTRTSFNSQISSIFKHPAKEDLYIAIADRWWGPQTGAEFESGERSRLVQSGIGKVMAKPPLPRTPAENAVMRYVSTAIPTSDARYVWLPIRFDRAGRPTIAWREEWSLDEFQ